MGGAQLAAAYARAKLSEGWRLVAWINAEDTESVLAGLAEIADSAELPGRSTRDAVEMGQALRQMLEADGHHCLIVFDNAPDADVLRPYVPAAGAAQVLITGGRRSLTNLGADVLVDMFTAKEAVTFLAAWTGLADGPGAAAVAAELGYVPLGLAQAAAVISRQKLAYGTYLERLRALPVEEYLAREQRQPYPHGTAEAVLLSLDAVRSTDRDGTCTAVMELMAVLSSAGVCRDLLYAAGQVDVLHRRRRWPRRNTAMVDQALVQLAEHSLLTSSLDRQLVSAHPLVMRVMRDQLARQGRLTAVCRAAAYLLDTRARTLEGPQDRRAVRNLLRQVHALLENAAGRAAETDDELAGMLLSLRLWVMYYLDELGDSVSQAVMVGESLVVDFERVRGRHHPDTLGSRNNLAAAYQAAGRVDEAIPLFEQTLAARERLLGPEHPDTLGSRSNLAAAYQAAGRVDEAIPLFEQILVTCERLLSASHPDTLAARKDLTLAGQEAKRAGN